MGDGAEKKNKLKGLGTRVLTGAALAVVLVATAIPGGWFWFGLVVLLSAVGLWEFYRLNGIEKKPVGIIGYLLAAAYLAVLAFDKPDFMFPVLVLGVIVLMSVFCLNFEKTSDKEAIAACFGVFYPVVLFSYLYRIRMMEDGLWLVILVFIAAFGSDIFAYFVGSLLGKHKLAPVLSPKKSIEGAVGGVVITAGIGALFGLLMQGEMTVFPKPVLGCALTAFGGAVISIFGDLTASAFKRKCGVKDYSAVLPGHGGVLDRFDSVLFTAPVIFYLAKLFL